MQIVEEPYTQEIINSLADGFREHAIEKMGYYGIKDRVCFTTRVGKKITGIVAIRPFWGTLMIEFVWVHKDYRNKKIGSALLSKALEYGQSIKASFAFVETLSYQALEFYENLGFQLEFTREGYSDGLKLHHLKKNLHQNPSKTA